MFFTRVSLTAAVFALLSFTMASPSDYVVSRDYAGLTAPNLMSLPKLLSPNASISYNASSVPRWSNFHGPNPGAIVNVATEKDVQTTVQYCLKHSIPFVAQNGAHGWQTNWNLNQNGLIINLRGLNSVTFNPDRTQATVQGGALVKETVDAAYAADAQLLTGNCNNVGVLGAGLGGGYGNLMGMYGFSVDQYISLNVVLADGSAVVVTEKSNKDLWFALRGAAPNFGIVTSAVMKSKPLRKSENMAWIGNLIFTEDKLEALVSAIQNLHLGPKMVVFLYYITSGAPDFTPTIAPGLFYYGTEAEGRAAFKPILDVGPVADLMKYLPYNEWNTGADGFGVKGGFKPSFGVGHDVMGPKAWRGVWEEYKKFVAIPGTGYSAVLAECYSHDFDNSKRPLSAPASFGVRNVKINSAIIPWYNDISLESQALAFGSKTREIIRAADALPRNQTYVNFAFGDETNDVVYGDNVARLKTLKAKYDPKGVFNHWFPIKV